MQELSLASKLILARTCIHSSSTAGNAPSNKDLDDLFSEMEKAEAEAEATEKPLTALDRVRGLSGMHHSRKNVSAPDSINGKGQAPFAGAFRKAVGNLFL